MSTLLFIAILALFCSIYLAWGFRTLPQEQWQFMAALPTHRLAEGPWHGVNLTWYGFFSANAYLVAIALFLILTGALAIPLAPLGLFIAALLGLCLPASRLVARIVEKKAHTLTVGGAVFVGLVASPVVLLATNQAASAFGSATLPLLPVLAALGIAYAFGEGLGRLACLSFGCCYGKPLSSVPRWLQAGLGPFAVRFFGTTRKIAYASNLEGERVLPIQGITALLFVGTGLGACGLFFAHRYATAFVLTVGVTQCWRVMSEFLRADFRGTGRLTAYQWMGLAAIPYALSIAAIMPSVPVHSPLLSSGLATVWTPGVLLGLQLAWLLVFFATGRSAVTGAKVSFHVHWDRT